MSVVVQDLWEHLPEVSLVTCGPEGVRWTEAIERSAVWSVPAALWADQNAIPLRWVDGALWWAVADPASWAVMQARVLSDTVRWCRTTLFDVKMAQWLLPLGEDNESRRFGAIAARRFGLSEAARAEVVARQRTSGGRFGEICLALGILTPWQVAEVLSEQTGLPLVNLLEPPEPLPASGALDAAWGLMTAEEWRALGMVPIRAAADELVVATADPFDLIGRVRLAARTRQEIRVVITGARDLEAVWAARYGREELTASVRQLADQQPENSARRTVTPRQRLLLIGVGLLFLACAAWHTVDTLAVVSSVLTLGYAILVAHRLWIIDRGTAQASVLQVTEEDLKGLDDSQLPVYTILIPVRDEAAVLPGLMAALRQLDYPPEKLDVKLLIDADDRATWEAARSLRVPGFVELVSVPVSEPRTKPRVCNFGLQRARGALVTIYDAEDLPEPTQLKKAWLAFQRAPARLACVQAKLSYFNAEQNLLTRWFTAEYGAWFDLLLPALHQARLPIPLGGTSNHFRTSVLRELGAWDPYNVTEDADLGMRLYKAGYQTAVLESITYEEANAEFVNWVRQRSRWIKGYLQTWLVHMRAPRRLWRQLGPRGFFGFQLAILGTPLMFLLNPVYWLLTSLWFASNWGVIPQLFPPGIYYLGMLNLLAGNFVFTYLNAVGAAKRGQWTLIPSALLTPLYWSMMSLASWKALLQLATRPSHWEKTRHGLADWTAALTSWQGGSPRTATKKESA
ncbi:MAG: glycosyltransferase [Firmicutes bacterium]|nr:glycosyltransferase [Bacillota bacterium]